MAEHCPQHQEAKGQQIKKKWGQSSHRYEQPAAEEKRNTDKTKGNKLQTGN